MPSASNFACCKYLALLENLFLRKRESPKAEQKYFVLDKNQKYFSICTYILH